MKRRSFTILLLILMTVLFCIPAQAATKPYTVKVTAAGKIYKQQLQAGKQLQLKVKNGNKVIKASKCKFHSSSPYVATVSKKGLIKARHAGTTTIAIRFNKTKSAWILLTVKEKQNTKTDNNNSTNTENVRLSSQEITITPYTSNQKSITISLLGVPTSEEKNVKWSIQRTRGGNSRENYSFQISSTSGATATIAVPGGACAAILSANYKNLTYTCKLNANGYIVNDLFYNGEFYYEDKYTQAERAAVLQELYPDFYGDFKKNYADKCSDDFTKIMAIYIFYKDRNFYYSGDSKPDMTTMISNSYGVCDQYSRMTYDLCCVAGVTCQKLVSWKLNHAWNQVKINGEWCVIDFVGAKLPYRFETSDDTTYYGKEDLTANNSIVSDHGLIVYIDGKRYDLSCYKCTLSMIKSDGTVINHLKLFNSNAYNNDWQLFYAGQLEIPPDKYNYCIYMENLLPRDLLRERPEVTSMPQAVPDE